MLNPSASPSPACPRRAAATPPAPAPAPRCSGIISVRSSPALGFGRRARRWALPPATAKRPQPPRAVGASQLGAQPRGCGHRSRLSPLSPLRAPPRPPAPPGGPSGRRPPALGTPAAALRGSPGAYLALHAGREAPGAARPSPRCPRSPPGALPEPPGPSLLAARPHGAAAPRPARGSAAVRGPGPPAWPLPPGPQPQPGHRGGRPRPLQHPPGSLQPPPGSLQPPPGPGWVLRAGGGCS